MTTGRGFTISAKTFGDSAYMSPGFLSNGHWIAKRDAVANEAQFRTADTAKLVIKAKYPNAIQERTEGELDRVWIKPDDTLIPYRVTSFIYVGSESGRRTKHTVNWRIIVDDAATDGQGVGVVDDAYLSAFGLIAGQVVYMRGAHAMAGRRSTGCVFNGDSADSATVGIMTGRVEDVVASGLTAIVAAATVKTSEIATTDAKQE